MTAIIDAAIAHARTVISTLVLLLLSGTIAYIEVPKEADPDINIPIIYVSMTHEGISPEDAERLLVRPMEQELRAIEGVKEMRSVAYQGGAYVLLEFEAGFDADGALADVREQVDEAKGELPDETDEPTVNEVNLSLFPVIVITLSGHVPERTLLRLARDLEDRIEAIGSVLDAEIVGDRDELVEVIIDPLLVESYGLAADDVVGAVSRSNRLIAAGALDTGRGRFAIKVPGLFEDVGDILDMPLKVSGDAVVTVADIATVRQGFRDPEGYARVWGRPAIALEVSKRTGKNIIDTVAQVRAVIEAERATWPPGIEVSYSQDKSEYIRRMLNDLQNNVISAILLVMVVVVAALGPRTGALVGVAIPGSFLAGILVLTVMGLTVNIVVLFSLILAVGMLVDGAIVVTEYADRKMAEGLHRRRAFALAAQRMSWPIITSTATTLAAFLPLMFWPGVVGEFMKYLPITLVATLSASLFMALVFIPTLGAYVGRPAAAKVTVLKALAGGAEGPASAELENLRGPTALYLRVLRAALKHPAKVLMAAVAVLVAVQWYYASHGNGIEFFPEVEPERAALQVHARGNLSVDEADALMAEVEARILDVAGFATVYARTGTGKELREGPEDIIGTVQIEFTEWDQRRPAEEILAEVKERLSGLAGITVERRVEEAGPPIGKPIQVELSARYPELLPGAVETVLRGFDAVGGLINIEDSRPVPGIEWEIDVDRTQAGKYGADIMMVGDTIKMVTNGLKFGEYRPQSSDEEIDIVARYPRDERNLEQLGRVRIKTADGLVPIGNFVTLSPRPKVSVINRTDGRRVMTAKADVAPGVLADDKVQALRAWLAQAGLDPRIDVAFKGEDEEQKEAQAFLVKAFAVALFIMAIILVTQFNSFYSALLILSAVVMSTIGVMIGLLAIGEPFGIVMSGIGVIALAGIVVNNNIVLIDTFDRLVKTAKSPREAILRTGAQRLRPVLLTTVTTILGLTPMVLGVNIDFITREVAVGAPATQWWTQLATAIVFGLGFATVLTLVVTPSALMVRANVGAWRARRRAGRTGPLPSTR